MKKQVIGLVTKLVCIDEEKGSEKQIESLQNKLEILGVRYR